MLNILIKHFKKILTLLIIAALFTAVGYGHEKDQYVKYSIVESTTSHALFCITSVVLSTMEYFTY